MLELVAFVSPTATFAVGVDRPWDSHKLENIGVCPRDGGRVLFSVLEIVIWAYEKKQVQLVT